jgi:hypothetical protein
MKRGVTGLRQAGWLACGLGVALLTAGTIGWAVEPKTPSDPAALTEKIRDLRARAAQWQWVRAEVDLVYTLGDTPAHWTADVFWRAPNKMSVFLRADGRKDVDAVYVWDSEAYLEYEVEASEATKIDVRALSQKFGAPALRRCGLMQESDPFQGLDEQSVRWLGEEQLNGETTLLFEGQQWPQYGVEELGPLRMLLWIGSDDGLLRRTEVYDPEGRRLMSQTTKVTDKSRAKKDETDVPQLQGDFGLKDTTAEAEEWLRLLTPETEKKTSTGGKPSS